MLQNKIPVAAFICLVVFVGNCGPVSAQTAEEERIKICNKAEKRYQKLFGHPSSDEDVTIVMMHKYTFCPPHVEVKQGTTVRFINVDKRTSHSVWFKESGKDESDRLFGEEKVEIKFDFPPDDYPYLCGPHWKEEGMIGTVTVKP